MHERQKAGRRNGGRSNGVEPSRSDKPNNVIEFPAHVSRQRAIDVAVERLRAGLERTDRALHDGHEVNVPAGESVVPLPLNPSRRLELADEELRRAMHDLSVGLRSLKTLVENEPKDCPIRTPGSGRAFANVVAFPIERCGERAVEYHIAAVADGLEEIRSARRELQALANECRLVATDNVG